MKGFYIVKYFKTSLKHGVDSGFRYQVFKTERTAKAFVSCLEGVEQLEIIK